MPYNNPYYADAQSYDSQARDIQRQRQIAEALGSYNMRQGQMVSGGFVGGSTLADVLAKAFSSYSGGQGQYAADQQAKALDAWSREENRQAWNDYHNLSDAEKQTAQNPAIYKYADPNAVGPTLEQLQGVQTSPVTQRNVQGTPLPPLQAAQQAPAQVRPTTGLGTRSVTGPLIDPRQAPQSEVPPTVAPAPQQVLAPAIQAQQAQRDPNALTPQEYAALRQYGVSASDKGPDFVGDRNAAGAVLSNLAELQAQRKRDAMDRLYNSGPRGRKQVEGLEAMEMARLAKGKGEDEYVTTSLGDGQYVTTNKRTGATATNNAAGGVAGQKQAREQGEFELKVQKELAPVELAVSDGQAALDKIDRFTALNSKYNAYGGLLSSAAGSIGKAFGSDAANEYDMAAKDVKASLLKQVFGGNPTEGERQYLDEVFGAFSAGKAPTERAMMQLRNAVQNRLNTNKAIATRYNSLISPTQSAIQAPQGASKSGLDWMPAK